MRLLSPVVLACGLFFLPLSVVAQPGAGEERPFIDLDGDGTTDFTLKRIPTVGVSYFDDGERVSKGRSTVMIEPTDNNGVIKRKCGLIELLSRGDLVDKSLYDTLTWGNDDTVLYERNHLLSRSKDRVIWEVYKPNNDEKYIGVRIVNRGRSYYGWIRVHVDSLSEKVSIQATDYNPRAGQPIRAGHKP